MFIGLFFSFHFCFRISINDLGIVSHKLDLDPNDVQSIHIINTNSGLKCESQSIYYSSFQTFDYIKLSKHCFPDDKTKFNEIVKVEFHLTNDKFYEFYCSLIYEDEFVYKLRVNSIPVLKFIISNLIMNCMKDWDKLNSIDSDFYSPKLLRGFKNFGSLISYYTNFFITNNTRFKSKEDAFNKFINYFLIFRDIRYNPDSFLYDHYVDALRCAVDFANLSEYLRDDKNKFIEFVDYGFEYTGNINIIKYVCYRIYTKSPVVYEYLDNKMRSIFSNTINQNEDHKTILIPKKDIYTLGIEFVRIMCEEGVLDIKLVRN